MIYVQTAKRTNFEKIDLHQTSSENLQLTTIHLDTRHEGVNIYPLTSIKNSTVTIVGHADSLDDLPCVKYDKIKKEGLHNG